MPSLRTALFVCLALFELLRYDLQIRFGGFPLVRRRLPQPASRRRPSRDRAAAICRAMNWATCLYWKPVKCLQKSVATVRLLRRQSLDARVVVGCRPEPFCSHAWVEIGGLVVNDSPLYQSRLPVLFQL